MTDHDLQAFTTGVVALSWTVAVLSATLHLLGVAFGWWSHDYLPTYLPPLIAMVINMVAMALTVELR